eukprot:2218798-Lingulodinium_polyedra.AAC.1
MPQTWRILAVVRSRAAMGSREEFAMTSRSSSKRARAWSSGVATVSSWSPPLLEGRSSGASRLSG